MQEETRAFLNASLKSHSIGQDIIRLIDKTSLQDLDWDDTDAKPRPLSESKEAQSPTRTTFQPCTLFPAAKFSHLPNSSIRETLSAPMLWHMESTSFLMPLSPRSSTSPRSDELSPKEEKKDKEKKDKGRERTKSDSILPSGVNSSRAVTSPHIEHSSSSRKLKKVPYHHHPTGPDTSGGLSHSHSQSTLSRDEESRTTGQPVSQALGYRSQSKSAKSAPSLKHTYANLPPSRFSTLDSPNLTSNSMPILNFTPAMLSKSQSVESLHQGTDSDLARQDECDRQVNAVLASIHQQLKQYNALELSDSSDEDAMKEYPAQASSRRREVERPPSRQPPAPHLRLSSMPKQGSDSLLHSQSAPTLLTETPRSPGSILRRSQQSVPDGSNSSTVLQSSSHSSLNSSADNLASGSSTPKMSTSLSLSQRLHLEKLEKSGDKPLASPSTDSSSGSCGGVNRNPSTTSLRSRLFASLTINTTSSSGEGKAEKKDERERRSSEKELRRKSGSQRLSMVVSGPMTGGMAANPDGTANASATNTNEAHEYSDSAVLSSATAASQDLSSYSFSGTSAPSSPSVVPLIPLSWQSLSMAEISSATYPFANEPQISNPIEASNLEGELNLESPTEKQIQDVIFTHLDRLHRLLGQDFTESHKAWISHFTEDKLAEFDFQDAMNKYIALLGDHKPVVQVLKASASQGIIAPAWVFLKQVAPDLHFVDKSHSWHVGIRSDGKYIYVRHKKTQTNFAKSFEFTWHYCLVLSKADATLESVSFYITSIRIQQPLQDMIFEKLMKLLPYCRFYGIPSVNATRSDNTAAMKKSTDMIRFQTMECISVLSKVVKATEQQPKQKSILDENFHVLARLTVDLGNLSAIALQSLAVNRPLIEPIKAQHAVVLLVAILENEFSSILQQHYYNKNKTRMGTLGSSLTAKGKTTGGKTQWTRCMTMLKPIISALSHSLDRLVPRDQPALAQPQRNAGPVGTEKDAGTTTTGEK